MTRDPRQPLRQQRPVALPNYYQNRHPVAGLRVTGIEVVQAVQRFTPTDPRVPLPSGNVGSLVGAVAGSRNNSVPLVSHKRTLARVYVASDVPEGVAVTGTMQLTPLDNKGAGPVDLGPPVWPVVAVPFDRNYVAKRSSLGGQVFSVNFRLPVDLLDGAIRLDATIRAVEAESPLMISGLDVPASGSVEVDFVQRTFPLTLVPMFVQWSQVPVANIDDLLENWVEQYVTYYAYLDQVRACFPAADESFEVRYLLGQDDRLVVKGNDLQTKDDWVALINQIRGIAANYDLEGCQVTAFLVGAPPSPLVKGMDNQVGDVLIFQDAQGFAHELGHAFGLGHPGVQVDHPPNDSRIPPITDDAGFDLSRLAFRAQGLPEMMNAVVSNDWWISSASWEALFRAFQS